MLNDIFTNVSFAELKAINEDLEQSIISGNRAESLVPYAKKVMEICSFDIFVDALALTTKLFYEEVAKRYFSD